MAINALIPLRAIPGRNAFAAYQSGVQAKNRNELAGMKKQAASNALKTATVQRLAKGVLGSDNPARAYSLGLRQLEAMGEDTSFLPQDYSNPRAQMAVRMAAMPEAEQTEFQRLISMLPPEERMQAARQKLGIGGKTYEVGGNLVRTGPNGAETIYSAPAEAEQPDYPSIVREAQYLFPDDPEKQRGYIQKSRNTPRTSVNVDVAGDAPEVGTIPQGYQLSRTPEGGWQMAPIPGSAASREVKSAGEKKAKQTTQTKRYGKVVLDSIDRVQDMVKNSAIPVTGMAGSLVRNIPGTNAYDTSALIDTIRANIGFDRLQQMRLASPTGGSLGQITERELNFLQSSLSNLDQAQSEDQLLRNLRDLEDIYTGIMRKASAYPDAQEFGFGAQQEAAAPDQSAPAGGGETMTVEGRTFRKVDGEWFEVAQ